MKSLTRRFTIRMPSGPLKGMRVVAVAGPKFLRGTYEKEFFNAFVQALKSGIVVYDIGAHWGFYSLVASRIVGEEGKVYAFEPVPSNVETIRKNLELNGIQNVDIFEMAVSDIVGTVHFDLGGDTGLGKISPDGRLEVTTDTLDNLIQQRHLIPPHVIKIDVEGSEVSVLQGALHTLREHRPILFIEMHGNDLFVACDSLLRSLGYTLVELEGTKRVMYQPT